jgi:hypothetical protein
VNIVADLQPTALHGDFDDRGVHPNRRCLDAPRSRIRRPSSSEETTRRDERDYERPDGHTHAQMPVSGG